MDQVRTIQSLGRIIQGFEALNILTVVVIVRFAELRLYCVSRQVVTSHAQLVATSHSCTHLAQLCATPSGTSSTRVQGRLDQELYRREHYSVRTLPGRYP